MISFCEVPRLVKLLETQSRMVFSKHWGQGRGNGDLFLMSTEFQFQKMKRALEVGLVIVLNQTLKNG